MALVIHRYYQGIHRYHIKKFITNLPRRGYIYDDFAILIMYDEECPENSYILKEPLT